MGTLNKTILQSTRKPDNEIKPLGGGVARLLFSQVPNELRTHTQHHAAGYDWKPFVYEGRFSGDEGLSFIGFVIDGEEKRTRLSVKQIVEGIKNKCVIPGEEREGIPDCFIVPYKHFDHKGDFIVATFLVFTGAQIRAIQKEILSAVE